MKINTIFAIVPIKNNSKYAFGSNNGLVCTNSLDMKRFQKLTYNHPLIMGRGTFESLGSKPLPLRHAIVITSKDIELAAGSTAVSSYDDAIAFAKNKLNAEECFVIGGPKLIQEAISKHVDTTYLTYFDCFVNEDDVDTFIDSDGMIHAKSNVTYETHNNVWSKVLGESTTIDTVFIEINEK